MWQRAPSFTTTTRSFATKTTCTSSLSRPDSAAWQGLECGPQLHFLPSPSCQASAAGAEELEL